MSCDYEGSESQPVWVNAVCDGLTGSPGRRGERELMQLCANSLHSRSGDHMSSVQSPVYPYICPSRETCSVM